MICAWAGCSNLPRHGSGEFLHRQSCTCSTPWKQPFATRDRTTLTTGILLHLWKEIRVMQRVVDASAYSCSTFSYQSRDGFADGAKNALHLTNKAIQMDNILNKISYFFRNLINEMGSIASSMSSEGWLVVVACLLICGYFWLRGNKIKST